MLTVYITEGWVLCAILVLFEYTVDCFTNELRQSIYDQVMKLKEYGVSVSKATYNI